MLDADTASKKAKFTKQSKYSSLKHLVTTSNAVERLFSKAKLIMTDQRKAMSPYHLDLSLFLQFNRHMWDAVTIDTIVNEKQEAVDNTKETGEESEDDDDI